ncbi:hypothetical protein RZS08_34720, partial [Arthrospira platensis SPKY1]|nr:hypothetical protein [Arthrospira platensis SPKY1]
MFGPQGGLGDLFDLAPGRGYIFNAQEDGELIYGLGTNPGDYELPDLPPFFCGDPFATFYGADIVYEIADFEITLDGGPMPAGAYIIAMYGDPEIEGCAGAMKWSGVGNGAMNINGADDLLP